MKSPLSYVGGKSHLSRSIVSRIPEHKTYCEVFAGAGWVFFRKDPSKYEVINDADSDLISFYRVLQNHLEEFLKQFKFILTSREWFEDWKTQIESQGLTDIQRAARYYYLQRLCFGGRVRGRTFGTAAEHPPRLNLLRMEEELSQVHLRLARVMIENLSWKELIAKYDRPGTFFYLDPPYYKTKCYKHNFDSLDQYRDLADYLRTISGRFILSLNDHEDIRAAFRDFKLKQVTVEYTVAKESQTVGKELLISNMELKNE